MIKDGGYGTALHGAVDGGQLAILNLLITVGANPNIPGDRECRLIYAVFRLNRLASRQSWDGIARRVVQGTAGHGQ
jgi:hypothetical protein